MTFTFIISISRWILPILAIALVIICGVMLVQDNRKTGTIGYLVNTANGDRMPLKSAETSIGRSNSCDIVLGYNTVSRFHAVITKRKGKWILFDTNSKTGTTVNQDRVIGSKMLENGDVLIFGNALFKFFEDLPLESDFTREHLVRPYSKPAEAAAFAKNDRINPSIVIPQMVEQDLADSSNLENCITGEIMKLNRRDSVVIGRASDADIRIDRPVVSRYHAEVYKTERGKWVVEDTGSQAGTLVNGEEILAPTPLYDSDIIEICGYTIKFNNPYS